MPFPSPQHRARSFRDGAGLPPSLLCSSWLQLCHDRYRSDTKGSLAVCTPKHKRTQ